MGLLYHIHKKEALNVIIDVVKDMNSELFLQSIDSIKIKSQTEFGSKFDFYYKDTALEDIEISMIGEYQVYNASLAIYTILILKEKNLINITDDQLTRV